MRSDLASRQMWIAAVLLAASTLLLHGISHGERVVPHRPLRDLPMSVSGWRGQDVPVAQRMLDVARVDSYVNRFYVDQAGVPIELYVGYYESQRTGDTIHSPRNCLPGAGWQPVSGGHVAVPLSTRAAPIVVNQYVIERGLDRQMVMYWYQGRGRLEASEYWGKLWMVFDAITRNRTDGALVRINTPAFDGEERARSRLQAFAQSLYPDLGQFIPN